MISAEVVSGPLPAGRERFLIPREARLRWSMLNPIASGRPLPPPMDHRPTFHLFWARNALYHGLSVLNLKAGDTVLVPAYHCSSLVEPLLHYGVTVRFYRIDRTCAPDVDDIARQIDGRTRALLAIHYFGFPQPIDELREFCDRHGLFLIEDCAHVLAGSVGGRPLGSRGDFAAFSWRKFLPMYDGGQLVVNNSQLVVALPLVSPSRLLQLRIWKSTLDRLVTDSQSNRTVAARFLRLLSAVGRRLADSRGADAAALAVNNYRLDFALGSVNVGMSGASRLILRNTDIASVVQLRRSNYVSLQRAFAGLPGLTPMFADLPDGVCPWVFPVLAPGRSEFHLALRARGIPAVTWGDVIHPDLPLVEFPDAAFLYANLVFLPVHQSLNATELSRMVSSISDALSSDA